MIEHTTGGKVGSAELADVHRRDPLTILQPGREDHAGSGAQAKRGQPRPRVFDDKIIRDQHVPRRSQLSLQGPDAPPGVPGSIWQLGLRLGASGPGEGRERPGVR